jgi:hypothetical protein
MTWRNGVPGEKLDSTISTTPDRGGKSFVEGTVANDAKFASTCSTGGMEGKRI